MIATSYGLLSFLAFAEENDCSTDKFLFGFQPSLFSDLIGMQNELLVDAASMFGIVHQRELHSEPDENVGLRLFLQGLYSTSIV